MPLTILSDGDVRELLRSLTRQDILYLQQSLADALHFYSTDTENHDNGCCPMYQPQRTSLRRKDGSTTLFMPASHNDGLGIKVVTLTTPDDASSDRSSSVPSVDSLSISSSSAASISSSSTTSFSASSSSTPTSPTPSSSTTAFSTSNPLIQDSSKTDSAKSTTPRGSLTLFDSTGYPRGLLNAEEITAFRTALASTMLFRKRHTVHEVTVFGAGKQAYWHIRLAILLRGPEIHHLNVINRSFSRASELLSSIWPLEVPSDTWELPKPKNVSILTPGHREYDRLLKEKLRASNAIFTTTPSTKPLFPREILTSTEGRKKGRYIAAVGSYKPHMLELDPLLLQQAVQPEHKHHHHRHARTGGAVIVDSVEACLKEAGEVIQAGLEGHQVVELGELVMLKRDMEARRRGSSSTEGSMEGVQIREEHGDTGLTDWLERGNVIYKSVGLGLMDVVVGNDLVRLADEKGVGIRIEDF